MFYTVGLDGDSGSDGLVIKVLHLVSGSSATSTKLPLLGLINPKL